MSVSSHSFSGRAPNVLGELLHSLSQPLTSLRCSLELSIEELAVQRQSSVAAALQQTEKVIGMIQLMREYLEAEQPALEEFSSELAPVVRSVVEGLSSIAAVRNVRLRLAGTCTASLPIAESRLRLALQYLIAAVIEAQPVGSKVALLLGEGPAGAVLRGEGERDFWGANFRDSGRAGLVLCRVRFAIASRVLEGAGASLVLDDGESDSHGFVLRVPQVGVSMCRH
jgi:signal transduction histidine kinase